MIPLAALLLVAPIAAAGSSAGGREYLSSQEVVPPDILFLLDLSADMGLDCGPSGGPASGVSCLDEVKEAIGQLIPHNDWARYGLVGIVSDGSDRDYLKIAPVGSTADAIQSALASVTAYAGTNRNLAEAMAEVAEHYIASEMAGDPDPWKNAPVQYPCQELHLIVLTAGRPTADSSPRHYSSSAGLAANVTCPDTDYGGDDQCRYDDMAYNLHYYFDARSDQSGDQTITTHTVGIKIDPASTADTLYQSASDAQGGEGIYTLASDGSELVSRLSYVMAEIRAGSYSRAAPVLSARGDRMVATYFEIAGPAYSDQDVGSLLGQGHVRAYPIDNDPESATYGEVLYTGSTAYDGALWDAGEQLARRVATAGELNPMDQDGFGKRDIFTYEPYLAQFIPATDPVWAENGGGVQSRTRMNFDASFVDAVADADRLWLFLNYLFNSVEDYDFDRDGDVDADDLQELIDFTRGVPDVRYRYLDLERGTWKLGDSPNATPAIVTARNQNFSNDATYRRFLRAIQQSQASDPALYPDIVLVPANDGMVHAFALEDYLDPSVGEVGPGEDDNQAGEELWAWVPAYVLMERKNLMGPSGYLETWSGSLIDQLLYGRTAMLDGSVTVEDVWIDADNDGVKTCDLSNFPASCEWHRVAVIQQGVGGPATLALDITVPARPEFLWEHPSYYDYVYGSPTPDPSARGRSTSRPVIVNLDDREIAGAAHDRWVAIWGSGRAVPEAVDSSYYASAEPSLYFWHMSEDAAGQYLDGVSFDLNGSNGHPEAATQDGLDPDGDGRYEYGYISGAITAVDYDSDGDTDVLYFPATTSYEPADLKDPDGDGQIGPSDLADPGSTWMYKAIIDPGDPDRPRWCPFIDPVDYGVVNAIGDPYRPEVYYAATAVWQPGGSLGLYWGSGSPYDRDSGDPGWFFGFTDPDPLSCTSIPRGICGTSGVVQLADGEGLTGDPVAFGGVVYFPTYTPGADHCTAGQGRIWGLDYQTCGPGIDTDGDGVPDASSIDTAGYPSALVVTDQGKLMWSGSGADPGDIADLLGPGSDPFRGVKTLMLKEIF